MIILKRAVWIGISFYVVSLCVGFVLSGITGAQMSGLGDISDDIWIINYLVIILFTFAFAWWYFSDYKTRPTPKNGLILGGVFFAIGAIFDTCLFLIYVLGKGTFGEVLLYLGAYQFWVSNIFMFLTGMATGALKQKKI